MIRLKLIWLFGFINHWFEIISEVLISVSLCTELYFHHEVGNRHRKCKRHAVITLQCWGSSGICTLLVFIKLPQSTKPKHIENIREFNESHGQTVFFCVCVCICVCLHTYFPQWRRSRESGQQQIYQAHAGLQMIPNRRTSRFSPLISPLTAL